jgi:glycine hydroxymethyltransferase
MGEAEMKTIAGWIGEVLDAPEDVAIQARIKAKVRELTSAFPLY